MSMMFHIAVAGAHLSGLPLNHQLTELGAKLLRTVRTAPVYKMYSLGPKPALIRQPAGKPGSSIELELWEMPIDKVGFFLRDGVKEPLGIGDVLLEDQSIVKGFIGEAYAVAAAPDITEYGGWRAYLASQQQQQQPSKQQCQGQLKDEQQHSKIPRSVNDTDKAKASACAAAKEASAPVTSDKPGTVGAA